MAINDQYKIDLAYKKLGYGTQATSTGKAGYDETIVSPVPTYDKDIWTEASQVPAVSYPGIPDEITDLIEKVTLESLVPKSGSSNTVFIRDVGLELQDFIPPTFGSGYVIMVYDFNDNFVDPGVTSYFFDYSSCTLVFPEGAGSYSGYTQPFKVSGYRYIGKKGLTSAGDSLPDKTGNAGKLLAVSQDETSFEYVYPLPIKQVVFQVGNDLVSGVQDHTEVKLPFNCKLINCEATIGVTSTLTTNLVIEVQRYISIANVWQWSTLYQVNIGIQERYKELHNVTANLYGERLRINLVSGIIGSGTYINYSNVKSMSIILNVELI